jgi:hypothetical protein
MKCVTRGRILERLMRNTTRRLDDTLSIEMRPQYLGCDTTRRVAIDASSMCTYARSGQAHLSQYALARGRVELLSESGLMDSWPYIDAASYFARRSIQGQVSVRRTKPSLSKIGRLVGSASTVK